MSGHMMYVWDEQQGNPSSIQEAISILNQLENAPAQLNSALYDFAQKLQLQAEESFRGNHDLGGNVEFVENFLNKKQQINTAILKLFLPMEDNFEIMQLVVETAKLTKVVIFDDRYGLLFLPSGQILPHDRASVYLEMCQLADEDIDEGYDLPQKEMEFAAWIEPYLNKLFNTEGFISATPPKRIKEGSYIKVTHELRRNIEYGFQNLYLFYVKHKPNSYTPYDGGYRMYISLDIHLPIIEDIYKVGDFRYSAYSDKSTFRISLPSLIKNNTLSHQYLFTNQINGSISISPIYSKEKVFELLHIYHNKIMPLANAMTTLKGINQVLNKDLYGWSDHYFHMHDDDRDGVKCLILAKLTNDPIFDELSEKLFNPKSIDSFDPQSKEEHKTKYTKLLKYLREEVKPLI